MKDLGKKCFAISKIEDIDYVKKISNFDWNIKRYVIKYNKVKEEVLIHGTKFIEENILFTDFIETMTGDTYAEQLVKTKELGQEEHNYFGLLAFGEIDTINPITRKFSLYK